MKKYLILSLMLFIFPTTIEACTTKDMAVLSKMYGNVETSYIFDENTHMFTVRISNLNQNLYYYDTLSKTYTYPTSTEVVIPNILPGEKIRYKFYGNYQSCINEGISSKYMTLPSYNDYYRDPLCKGYEDYKLCLKWTSVNYSYDEFLEKMDIHIKKENIKKENDKEVLGIFDNIIIFVKKYIIFIIPFIIVGIGIFVYRKYKNSKLF